MNKKNRGFSILVAIVGSLILMGIAVAIIASVNRSLDQVNNIARANQFFFAAESGKEAALFHHNVRGAGLIFNAVDNPVISHTGIEADVEWSINGREESGSLTGEFKENEKVTIPLYWDSADDATDAESSTEISSPAERQSLELEFSTTNDNFDFGNISENAVLIVWSVSREHATNGVQTFIPNVDNPQYPCGYSSFDSSFYCKGDLPGNTGSFHRNFTSGIIDFGSTTTGGIIFPDNDDTQSLSAFMGDATSSNYEISFQPVLPFTDSGDNKISVISFELTRGTGVEIPQDDYTITSSVDFGDFEKEQEYTYSENPAIGAFDYLIFE